MKNQMCKCAALLGYLLLLVPLSLNGQWDYIPTSPAPAKLAYGNGIFVAVFTSDKMVNNSPVLEAGTSKDLVTWEKTDLPRTGYADATVFLNGEFWVFVQDKGAGYALRSADGITWTEVRPGPLGFGIAYGSGIWAVAGGGGGTRNISTSVDGTTWTRFDSSMNYHRGIAWGNDRFVSVAYDNDRLLSFVSSDSGQTWSDFEMAAELHADYGAFAFANGKFAFLAGRSSSGPGIPKEIFVYHSATGETWDVVTLSEYTGSGALVSNETGFHGLGVKDSDTYYLSSADAVTWGSELIGSSYAYGLVTAGDAVVVYTWNGFFVKGDLPTGPAAPPAPWQDAISHGDTLYQLEPFGYFWISTDNYIYHPLHGWLYVLGTSAADLWVYDYGLGWLWMNAASYPLIWCNDLSSWISIHNASTPEQRSFYNYTTGEFETLP